MSPDTKIANLQISGAKHMWKLLGPGMYNARPLFPITVRELLQNSHDAQRSAGITYPVAFTIARDASCNFTLTCDDAGIGMDAATIHDKFLVLGESGKEEGVGGFGVAKASILGACSSWELKTLDNLLTSEMLGLAPISKSEHRPGCSVALKYEVTEGDALKPTSWAIRDAMCYLVTSDVATKLVMNDNGKETVFNSPGTKVDEKRLVATVEEGRTSLKIYLVPQIKIDSYTSFGYGVSEHTIKGKIIYRLNGLTQFIGYSRNSSAEFNAIVDVTTESRPRELDYPFTVSREEMVYKFSNVIDEKLQPLFVNNLSTEIMMREKCGEKEVATTYYDGDLCASYGKISKTREKKERRGKEKAEREREQEEAANREREALNRELSGVMAEFVDSEERNELPDVKSVRRAIVPTSVQVVLDKVLERSPTGIKTCLKIAGKHKNSKPLTTRNIKLLIRLMII